MPKIRPKLRPMDQATVTATSQTVPTVNQMRLMLDSIDGFPFIMMRSEHGVDTFEYLSPNVQRYLGIDVDQLLANARLFLECIEPNDRFIIHKALAKAEHQPQRFNFRVRLKPKDHEHIPAERWLRIKAVSECLASGAFRLTGYCEDTTERQRAFSEISQQAELVTNMVNELPGFVYLYETHTSGLVRFPFVSERMEEVYGVHPSEVRDDAAAVWSKVHLDDLQRVASEVEHSFHTQTVLDVVFRLNHPRKGVIHIRVTGTPKRINPITQLLAGYAQDITADVLREQELHKAKTQAEQAMRAKDRFIANISHELRTPIHGTMGLLDILLETDNPLNRDDLAQKAKQSLSHLLSVVNEILDISKLAHSELSIHKEQVNLPTLLIEMRGFFQSSIQQQGLFLSVEWDERLNHTSLLIDPKRLRQILLNLIGNALKFTDSGGVTVKVFLTKDDHGIAGLQHPSLRIEVTDTGVGIPMDSQTLLFQPFFQVDSDLGRKHKGTGLGLTLCKQLVELMGGEIWVSSIAGQGSTFGFRFPVSVVEEESEHTITTTDTTPERSEESSVQTTASPAPSVSTFSGKVLSVDDNEINQLIIKTLLETRGIDVTVANNGKEALEITYSTSYDLILMDIHMPQMDGLEATRRLRELQVTTPIIALSAAVSEKEIDAALDSGMDGFLAKPLKVEELNKILANYLTACQ